MRRKKQLLPEIVDRKSWWTYAMLNLINGVATKRHFHKIEVIDADKLPAGPFIVVANHSARWDGPVVHHVLARPANWMVTPSELRGLQGILLRAFGAFPADPRLALIEHMRKQVLKAEPIVIFPEGDIYRDGSTHSFKPGAARIALLCAEAGLSVPIVPMAIKYGQTIPESVQVAIGEAIDVSDSLAAFRLDRVAAIRALTQQLHREVCHLRADLGSEMDRYAVMQSKPNRVWMPRSAAQAR